MQEEFFDWSIIVLNYLIFVLIFIRTLRTDCFNTFDLSVTFIGLGASILLLIIKLINKKREK